MSCAFLNSKTYKSSTFVTRNNATYNWSWKKIENRKSTSTIFKNWFCDLFTIIAKHKRIENCFRWTIQNKSFEKLLIAIFKINRICSFILSSKIRIFKTNLRIFVTIKQISLQNFFLKYKFRNNMIEISIFNRKMSKNNEKIFKNRKYSIKISSIRNSFVIKFTNVIVCVFFDKEFRIKSFNFATISLYMIRIILFKKQSVGGTLAGATLPLGQTGQKAQS